MRTRGVSANCIFSNWVIDNYLALMRRLDDEGLAKLERGELDHPAYVEQLKRYRA
jgi:hypothetical protein